MAAELIDLRAPQAATEIHEAPPFRRSLRDVLAVVRDVVVTLGVIGAAVLVLGPARGARQDIARVERTLGDAREGIDRQVALSRGGDLQRNIDALLSAIERLTGPLPR